MVFRNYWKNKLFSIVNCLGLSISIVLIFFLTIYVSTEKSVDQFHKNERIYRVLRNNECAFSPPFGQYIVDNIEGAESFCRIFVIEATLKSDFNLIKSPNCYYADANFFEIFSFPVIKGTPENILESSNSVALSESFSKKLFPNQDPVGKKIRFNNRLDYIVTGVFKDFSENTHFKQADIILPYRAFNDFLGGSDFTNQYNLHYFLPALYVVANENTDLSSKGDKLYRKAKPWYWLFQEDGSKNTQFQPLKDVYLNQAEYGFPLGTRTGNNKLITAIILIVFA
ncbi:MAG TPA: ABC transporter permease, partial [Bacteroidales bacterium]|nr:ABC transporter permease [Bacteroidales bacterium]